MLLKLQGLSQGLQPDSNGINDSMPLHATYVMCEMRIMIIVIIINTICDVCAIHSADWHLPVLTCISVVCVNILRKVSNNSN